MIKYDKYGDPITEKPEKMDDKRKKAFVITMALQILVIILNVVFFIAKLNYYCFILLPLYIFFYISYVKAVQTLKDDGILTKPYQLFKFISPVVYLVTAFLCMLAIAV